MWIYIVTKFYAKRLSPSENIVENRRSYFFLTHPVYDVSGKGCQWTLVSGNISFFAVIHWVSLKRDRQIQEVYSQFSLSPMLFTEVYKTSNKHRIS